MGFGKVLMLNFDLILFCKNYNKTAGQRDISVYSCAAKTLTDWIDCSKISWLNLNQILKYFLWLSLANET